MNESEFSKRVFVIEVGETGETGHPKWFVDEVNNLLKDLSLEKWKKESGKIWR